MQNAGLIFPLVRCYTIYGKKPSDFFYAKTIVKEA